MFTSARETYISDFFCLARFAQTKKNKMSCKYTKKNKNNKKTIDTHMQQEKNSEPPTAGTLDENYLYLIHSEKRISYTPVEKKVFTSRQGKKCVDKNKRDDKGYKSSLHHIL